MSETIECGPFVSVKVGLAEPWVSVDVRQVSNRAIAYLTVEGIDALIRALAAARVEISKEPPK